MKKTAPKRKRIHTKLQKKQSVPLENEGSIRKSTELRFDWQSIISLSFGLSLIGLSVLVGIFHSHKVVSLVDWLATYAITALYSDTMTQVMKVVTDFGYYGTIGIWMGLLGAGIVSKRWYLIMLTIVLSLIPYLSGFGLKTYFERERPMLNPLVVESHYSYPSLHALSSMVLYLTLSYVIYHYTGAYWRSLTLLIGGIVVINAVAFSRMYLGVHYFSDVLGGILLGGGLFLLLVTIIKAFFDKKIKLYIARND